MRSKTVERLLKSTPKDVEIFVDWYADIVVRINQILREKNMTQNDLAIRLGKSPSEVSKWLNGQHNFTLRSLAKLSAELGENLLEVPNRKTETAFLRGNSRSFYTFVVYKSSAESDYTKIAPFKSSIDFKAISNVG